MFLLTLLLFPIVEIWSLIRVGHMIGLVNTLFALLVAAVLGMGLMKTQGRYMLVKFQQQLAAGETPANTVFHSILIFVGGLLFMIPGFVSDSIALFLVLPGSRHLLVSMMKRKLMQSLQRGQFRVFNMGGFGTRASQRAPREDGTRDVTPRVIDVTPIRSETARPKSEDDSIQ